MWMRAELRASAGLRASRWRKSAARRWLRSRQSRPVGISPDPSATIIVTSNSRSPEKITTEHMRNECTSWRQEDGGLTESFKEFLLVCDQSPSPCGVLERGMKSPVHHQGVLVGAEREPQKNHAEVMQLCGSSCYLKISALCCYGRARHTQ